MAKLEPHTVSWICETFHLYTTFDPEVAENQEIINAAFVR
jgi:hypothetical protein